MAESEERCRRSQGRRGDARGGRGGRGSQLRRVHSEGLNRPEAWRPEALSRRRGVASGKQPEAGDQAQGSRREHELFPGPKTALARRDHEELKRAPAWRARSAVGRRGSATRPEGAQQTGQLCGPARPRAAATHRLTTLRTCPRRVYADGDQEAGALAREQARASTRAGAARALLVHTPREVPV